MHEYQAGWSVPQHATGNVGGGKCCRLPQNFQGYSPPTLTLGPEFWAHPAHTRFCPPCQAMFSRIASAAGVCSAPLLAAHAVLSLFILPLRCPDAPKLLSLARCRRFIFLLTCHRRPRVFSRRLRCCLRSCCGKSRPIWVVLVCSLVVQWRYPPCFVHGRVFLSVVLSP